MALKVKRHGIQARFNRKPAPLRPKYKAQGQITPATGSFTDQTAAISPIATPRNTATAPAAPSAPSAPAPTAAPTPTASMPNFNVSSYSGSGVDPRDASYFANLAKLQATARQDYSGTQAEQTNADVNYQQGLQQKQSDRQQSIRNVAEQMLRSGLLQSGYHDRTQTENLGNYLQDLTGYQTQKSQSDQARAAKMAAILQNLGVDEQNAYADALGRYTFQAQQEAADRAAADVTPWPSNTDEAMAYTNTDNPRAAANTLALLSWLGPYGYGPS